MLLNIIVNLIPVIIYGIVLWLTNRKKLEGKWNTYHRLSNMASLAILIVTYITPVPQVLGYSIALIVLLVELIVSKNSKGR